MFLVEHLIQIRDCWPQDSLEQRIASYILLHPEETVTIKLRELASRIYVSPAAVVRFLKQLPVQEYRLFQNEFRKDYVRYCEEMRSYVSLSRCPMTVYESEASRRLFFRMKKAGCILFCGMPRYWQLFQPLVHCLNQRGIRTVWTAFESEPAKRRLLAGLKENDLVLFVFPEYNLLDIMYDRLNYEPDFVGDLEKGVWSKWFLGQFVAEYHPDWHTLAIPYEKDYAKYADWFSRFVSEGIRFLSVTDQV